MSRHDGVTVAAVDLGASTGRVMAVRVAGDAVDLSEVHRFANVPVPVRGSDGLQRLHWDVLALHRGVLDGLLALHRAHGRPASVGVDTWAVDYGLLDAGGALLANPTHYRDARHRRAVDAVHALVPPAELHRVNGLQHQPFNTVFQLCAERAEAYWPAASRVLLMPDLLGYWLTGSQAAEVTNASTTGLLDVSTRRWSVPLLDRLGLDPGLLAELVEPGTMLGEIAGVGDGVLDGVPVTAVGSHDTASAVVGVPAREQDFAYISCGTWSLVGVELDAPVLTGASRTANFTNELGVDGTVRFLRNVMGLWLQQESMRHWAASGRPVDLAAVLREAAAVPALRTVVDAGSAEFLPPGDMPARIASAAAGTGQPVPRTPAEVVRCVVDSLALAYREAVREAAELAGRDPAVVHLVGGGAQNRLLCQLTADATGLPVLAGPVEAAALGNALVQARAGGAVGRSATLAELRSLVAATQRVERYRPSGEQVAWDAAAARLA